LFTSHFGSFFIGDVLIFRFIEETTTLEDLDISFNCLQVVGIEHIAKVSDRIFEVSFIAFISIISLLGINSQHVLEIFKCASK
jgi:hypothetical protein